MKKNAIRNAGFSIIDLIIAVSILGIIASVAAPTWHSFIKRQRVRIVASAIEMNIRKCQAISIQVKRNCSISFFDQDGLPGCSSNSFVCSLESSTKLKPYQIEIYNSQLHGDTINFDFNGGVELSDTHNRLPFVIKIASPNRRQEASSYLRSCVIVDSILASFYRGKSLKECPDVPSNKKAQPYEFVKMPKWRLKV